MASIGVWLGTLLVPTGYIRVAMERVLAASHSDSHQRQHSSHDRPYLARGAAGRCPVGHRPELVSAGLIVPDTEEAASIRPGRHGRRRIGYQRATAGARCPAAPPMRSRVQWPSARDPRRVIHSTCSWRRLGCRGDAAGCSSGCNSCTSNAFYQGLPTAGTCADRWQWTWVD